MKSWRFVANATITLITDVKAESLEEARMIAEQRGVQGLCYACSGKDPDRIWSLTGELDAEPVILDGEEIEL